MTNGHCGSKRPTVALPAHPTAAQPCPHLRCPPPTPLRLCLLPQHSAALLRLLALLLQLHIGILHPNLLQMQPGPRGGRQSKRECHVVQQAKGGGGRGTEALSQERLGGKQSQGLGDGMLSKAGPAAVAKCGINRHSPSTHPPPPCMRPPLV